VAAQPCCLAPDSKEGRPNYPERWASTDAQIYAALSGVNDQQVLKTKPAIFHEVFVRI
jgi:hypothetical protein